MDQQIHDQPSSEEQKPLSTQVMDIKPVVGVERPHSLPADPAMSQSPEAKSSNNYSEVTDSNIPDVKKQSANGTGSAIFATVVIAIVLATLATYAYLKTVK